jgi:lysophospholipase L1-like esterase
VSSNPKYQKGQKIKPVGVLVILLIFNGLLGILSYVSPKEGWKLSESLTLSFPGLESVFSKDTTVVVSLDSVLADVQVTDDIDTLDYSVEIDSNRRLVLPPGHITHPLAGFFIGLDSIQNQDNTIHVLHYGDSQLEGDRISSYLRKKLQRLYGGLGPGIVLPIDISRARRTILQSESRDWRKFAVYGNLPRVPKGKMGLGASSYIYTGSYQKIIGYDTALVTQKPVMDSSSNAKDSVLAEVEDTSKLTNDTVFTPLYQTEKVSSSWLRFRANSKTDSLCRSFSTVAILYHGDDTSNIVATIGGKIIRKTLYPSSAVRRVDLYQGLPVNNVTIQFFGPSPYLHGVLLDGKGGVAVDNFPMRGSSGLGFASIQGNHYAKMLELTNSKLIIMQYGVNVIPNPQKNYDYYYRMFVKQLEAIKAADSTVSILVIGPSDMSRKRMGKYESYPNIPLIRDAMKKAAFENGCAFWDLYAAMGGKNSMVSWVQNKPALAGTDYTHFNTKGAEYVGQMLFEAILYEYETWLIKKQVNGS